MIISLQQFFILILMLPVTHGFHQVLSGSIRNRRTMSYLSRLNLVKSQPRIARNTYLLSTSTSNVDDLVSQIKEKGNQIRSLKEAKADKSEISPIL